jgi:hypothetical protein
LDDDGGVSIAQEIASFAASSRQASLPNEGKCDAFVLESDDITWLLQLRNMWGIIFERSLSSSKSRHTRCTSIVLLYQISQPFFRLVKATPLLAEFLRIC